MNFKITIRGKEVDVKYEIFSESVPHFEFYSDGSVVSDTGYRSHFLNIGERPKEEEIKELAQKIAKECDKENFGTQEQSLTGWVK